MERTKGGKIKANGAMIEELRLKAGLTIDDLARKAGVSKRTIDNYLAGEKARILELKSVAIVLGVPFSTLIAGSNEQPPKPDKRITFEMKVSIPFGEGEKSPEILAFISVFQTIMNSKNVANFISVTEGSTILTVEMDAEDLVRLLQILLNIEKAGATTPQMEQLSAVESIWFFQSPNPDAPFSIVVVKDFKREMQDIYRGHTNLDELFRYTDLILPSLIVAIHADIPEFQRELYLSLDNMITRVMWVIRLFKSVDSERFSDAISSCVWTLIKPFRPDLANKTKALNSDYRSDFDTE